MTIHTDACLEVLYFNLFDDCNARCNMCKCWTVISERKDLEVHLALLSKAMTPGLRAIRFTGGEPLLLECLPALVQHAAARGARVSVITNGRLLAAKAAALAEAGCAEIVVSIDGPAGIHDLVRGTPGLFKHLTRGINAVSRTGMVIGVNTVIQRFSADALDKLADILVALPRRPAWWHLIPVRDHPELTPDAEQAARMPAQITGLRSRLESEGITVIADAEMFTAGSAPGACSVPSFVAFARVDNGLAFGCNMLAYAGGTIGQYTADGMAGAWTSSRAGELRARCAAGRNPACARCDRGSQQMNHYLRMLATAPPAGDESRAR